VHNIYIYVCVFATATCPK